MARYPTYEEYAKDGKFQEGIKRCDDLLKKNSKDVTLLTTKLQLICASRPDDPEGPRILDQLVATQPAIQDLNDLVSIELAVADSFSNTYPPPRTLGPVIRKLWDNAYKANSNGHYRSELLALRYQRAIYDNRIEDVQQTLIQLKQSQPKNRAVYMAHAAYTQLLSTTKDDLQSKLALGLARKAVSEKFDDDRTLDCRVAGQIFALQKSEQDLEGIRERQAFRESKQVYDALQLHRQQQPITSDSRNVSTESPREWLESRAEEMKATFKQLLDTDAAVEGYEAFVAKAIQLLHTATTTLDLGVRKRAAAEPCYLAISGLVKLYSEFKGKQAYLLQAAFLAEQLLKFEPEVHEARLILVYLYMRLGLGSEAMRLFDSLSIKEVQYDTVGHTLFTRISTTHPFRTALPNGHFFEPHDKTNKALQVPPRHENKLFEAEAAVLEHKQTGMIFELNGLRDEIRLSFMRRVTLLEHRRLARLSGKGYGRGTSDIGPRVIAAWTNLKDNRDFNATFNFGFNVEKALQGNETRSADSEHVGMLPGRVWLVYNLAMDQAHSLASKQIPLITDSLVDTLQTALDDEKATAQLTQAERLSAHAVCTLLPILDAIKASKPPTKDDIDLLTLQIEKLNIPTLCASHDPLAQTLHACYVYIDFLLIIVRTCNNLASGTVLPEITTLHAMSFAHVRKLQEYATKISAQAKSKHSSNALTALKENETIMLFGEKALGDFAQRVAASAKDGWDGIGKIVMPES